MKTIFISVIVAAFFSITTKASDFNTKNDITTIKDSVKQSPFNKLLPQYYEIKNALVSSDPYTAADRAGEFVKSISKIEMKALSSPDMNVFMSFKTKLINDATIIANNKNLKQQRDQFNSFSGNMFAFTKALKLNSETVYYDYCPMQKAYWLSNEATIKNPYFGNAMLTCGKITETLH